MDPAAVDSVLRDLIGAKRDASVRDAVFAVLEVCEAEQPHPDWERIRSLPWDAEDERVRQWAAVVLPSSNEAPQIRGLFFSLCYPSDGAEWATLDLELTGTAEYSREDGTLEWLFSQTYFSDASLESPCLDALYEIARGSHDWRKEPYGLGNDAEYPIGLAYTVAAARLALTGGLSARWLDGSLAIGVAAGWKEGDVYVVGEIQGDGFLPPASNHPAAPDTARR